MANNTPGPGFHKLQSDKFCCDTIPARNCVSASVLLPGGHLDLDFVKKQVSIFVCLVGWLLLCLAWFCSAVNLFVLDKGRCVNLFVLSRDRCVNLFCLGQMSLC